MVTTPVERYLQNSYHSSVEDEPDSGTVGYLGSVGRSLLRRITTPPTAAVAYSSMPIRTSRLQMLHGTGVTATCHSLTKRFSITPSHIPY